MHHYNFPPYSVGDRVHARPEAPRHRPRRARPAGARADDPHARGVPYTVRIVSETLGVERLVVDGLGLRIDAALMDAGVPIKAPVGGIAMGLVKEGDDYVILTDIQGAEDHLGDMDFKVAGSRDGITALQMDIKITGVTQEIMRNALEQAKQAREFILDKMGEAIPRPAPSSPSTRRGSPRSRSTRSRSGWSSASAAR